MDTRENDCRAMRPGSCVSRMCALGGKSESESGDSGDPNADAVGVGVACWDVVA